MLKPLRTGPHRTKPFTATLPHCTVRWASTWTVQSEKADARGTSCPVCLSGVVGRAGRVVTIGVPTKWEEHCWGQAGD